MRRVNVGHVSTCYRIGVESEFGEGTSILAGGCGHGHRDGASMINVFGHSRKAEKANCLRCSVRLPLWVGIRSSQTRVKVVSQGHKSKEEETFQQQMKVATSVVEEFRCRRRETLNIGVENLEAGNYTWQPTK